MFLSALLVLAASQAPTTNVQNASGTPAAKQSEEDKIVCKREDPIGSRINTRRVCLKQSEWDALSRQAQQDWEGSRNDRNIPPNP